MLYIMTMTHDTGSSISCSLRSTLVQTLWLLGMAISTAAGIVAIALLKPGLAFRILAVAVPLGCGVAYTIRLLRDLAKLDELQLRIQLEAAATACLGVFIAALLYPVLQIAGFVGPLQPYYVVFLLVGTLMIGYLNAVRRYR